MLHAAEMNQIDVSEVKRRSKIAYELINKISEENNRNWVGWEGQVTFDEEHDGQIKGRNFAYKQIFVKEKPKIGQISNVKIIDSTTHSLIGQIMS